MLLTQQGTRNIETFEVLKSIDWNFGECKTNHATHDFHPYPAKFIPQIPNNLIKIFTKENDVVYDPFCGSGTTVVESILEHRRAIGNDVNPLAVLISKVKSTPLTEKKIELIENALSKIVQSVNYFYDSGLFINEMDDRDWMGEAVPNLKYWFDENVIKELAIIKKCIFSEKDKDVMDFLGVAFASIIVSVSYQDSNTRYVRVNKEIKSGDVVTKFKAKTLRMLNRIREIPSLSENPNIKMADSREVTGFKDNSADVAITSPPYPNAYDYHLYHKYRMYWLEMDPLELKRREIGAHAHYSKKNGFTAMNFKDDMERVFVEVSRVLKKDKYFCIVIGDSIIKGEKVRNNELLKDLSRSTPFNFEYELKRDIQLSKKSFNPKIGNIKTEHIMVFKNTKY